MEGFIDPSTNNYIDPISKYNLLLACLVGVITHLGMKFYEQNFIISVAGIESSKHSLIIPIIQTNNPHFPHFLFGGQIKIIDIHKTCMVDNKQNVPTHIDEVAPTLFKYWYMDVICNTRPVVAFQVVREERMHFLFW